MIDFQAQRVKLMSSMLISTRFMIVFESISLVYWIITVPFYVFLVSVLIHAQKKNVASLRSSFFKLCITAGFTDIVTMLNNYLGAIFPRWGWFTNVYLALGKPFVYIHLIISWGAGINQALSVSILAANRLSAVLVPHLYEEFWHGRRLILAMIIQTVPGYIAPAFVLRNKVELTKMGSGGLLLRSTNMKTSTLYNMISGLLLAINGMFLISAYSYLFCVLRRRREARLQAVARTRAQRDRHNDVSKRRENRLLLMASGGVSIQLMIIIIMMTNRCSWFPLTLEQFYIVYDQLVAIYSGINAYLLWIFSDALRNHVYSLLRIRKRSVNPAVTKVSSNCSVQRQSLRQ